MKFQSVKGTRDFYPEDKNVQQIVFDSLRQSAVSYNFREIESPVFESLPLLTRKEGEEISEQIFVLKKRSSEELGLRFDLTVPAVRMFIEKQRVTPKPVKWFYLSRMWRYEQPQAGRDREFYQFSVEVFGSSKPEADAEIINLAIDSLLGLGLKEKDFVVKVSNRNLVQSLLGSVAGKKLPDVLRLVDKFSKIGEEAFRAEIKKIDVDDKKVMKIISERDISKLKDADGLEELKQVLSLVKRKCVTVDLSTVRGLAYYTGTVFEIFDAKQKFRAIAGGGRYDNLVELLGGEACPATGFALGYSTLTLLLQEKGLLPEADTGVDYFIATVGDVAKEAGMIAEMLRKKSTVETDLMQRGLGKQFNYANSVNARKVVIVGPEELKKKSVKVRDMQSGKEELVEIDEL